MNILLVEDDPTDSKLLSAVLQFNGHSVRENQSAEQAVEEIKAHRPDLILLDLKLPGMDGLALARLLKRDAATKHIAIVAVTAAFEIFGSAMAFDAGCDAYIIKPVDTRRLGEQILRAAAHASAPPRQG